MFQGSYRFNPNKRKQRHTNNKNVDMELRRAIAQVQVVKKEKPQEIPEYVPQNGFSDFPINDALKHNISYYQHYEKPTPIQDQAIPAILAGKDVIGIANTGTGKTAAFLIPLVNKVAENRNERVFILAPTRELALQIDEELKVFAKSLSIHSVLCIGGLSLGRQKNDLRNNPHFVIGTPGRIRDLIQERAINLGQFKTVVLDEADRMVDIGFIADIKYFISLLPVERQSLFFSATIDGKVKEIIAAFVRNSILVSVKQQDTAENVEQDVIHVKPGQSKIDALHDLLAEPEFSKVLIFGRTKWGVQKLTDELVKRGFRALAIHGNKSQGQRSKALEQFKQGNIQILLATDVASRGLDIDNVTHVINYDMPASMEDYVHRIGRTGRADKKGIALTFVDEL